MASSPVKVIADAPAERASRLRQRQRLIDACISALHSFGPSRTTVEKVVAIAGLSPGTVSFYFDSKAAMMVATLEQLASEFEQLVVLPVAQLKDHPVRALELLVDLYLDPEIASPRKVSVWYAFWGEATSRKEYYDICGKRDDSCAALVRDLIERLMAEAREPHLDADGIALGLIGALEILWQSFAFQTEATIDRAAAKRRCMAYLRSVFPAEFGAGARAQRPARARPAVSPYASETVFALERERLFLPSWQLAGHGGEIPATGDYLTVELLGERAFVHRDRAGGLRAFRNSCRHRPHAVAPGRSGRFERGISCPTCGLAYDEDGRLASGAGLAPLDVAAEGGLIFVRLGGESTAAPPAAPPGIEAIAALATPVEIEIAADWKVVVEQWLESATAAGPGRRRAVRDAMLRELPEGLEWTAALPDGWGAGHYARLATADRAWPRRLVYPNLLMELAPEGATLLQVLPTAPGRCRVRRFHDRREDPDRKARALEYLVHRLADRRLARDAAIAASTQTGLTAAGYEPPEPAGDPPGLRAFRAWLAEATAG